MNTLKLRCLRHFWIVSVITIVLAGLQYCVRSNELQSYRFGDSAQWVFRL
jgi:hypothetical protein